MKQRIKEIPYGNMEEACVLRTDYSTVHTQPGVRCIKVWTAVCSMLYITLY